MKFITPFLTISAVALAHSFANADTPPSWYDLKDHVKQVQSKLPGKKVDLENLDVKKVDIGTHKLILTTARYGAGQSEEGGGYNVSEVFVEPATAMKPIFKIVDKTGCESKVTEDISSKKLGAVGDNQIYFVSVQMVSPSCPKSEVTSPKIFMVLQESKKGVEKVYQSNVSENGKYRIDFKKEIIHFEYTHNVKEGGTTVDLVWDEGAQKFKAQD